MFQEPLIDSQECISEGMIQRLSRALSDVETVSMTIADAVRDGEDT